MKKLITSTIIAKFKDTISEKEYKKGWESLQEYQANKEIIKTYKETEFQSEFLSQIFGDILGYIPRSRSLKDANLIVEKKIENGQKFIDGAIIDRNGQSKIIIELKGTQTKDLLKSIGGKGGLHSLAPIQQAAVYLFSESIAELAIVSNFDKVIIFDSKELFRQEFSLFDMDYEEFKEFFLILNSKSFWSGLTRLMINQSTNEEKIIDDEFYVKTTQLYKMLDNQLKPDYRDDLFNKFLALAIQEDSGKLPTNLVNMINERRYDFDHTASSSWTVWTEFFKSMKKNHKKMEYLNISKEVYSQDVWQNISYLGRVKVSKATMDLLVEISKYDLFSVPMDQLFFEISRKIHEPYDLIDSDDQFTLYNNIMDGYFNNNIATAGFQTLAFVSKKSISIDYPLVKLFNELSSTKIEADSDSNIVITNTIIDRDEYFLAVESDELQDPEFINTIRDNVFAINLNESYDETFVIINMKKNPGDKIHISRTNSDGTVYEQNPIQREDLGDRVIILTEEEQSWLDTYNKDAAKPGSCILGDLVTLVPEAKAKIRFNLYTKSVTLMDDDLGVWEESIDDWIDSEYCHYIFFVPKTDYAHLVLKSRDFLKMLQLVSFKKDNILDLKIASKLVSPEFLQKAKEQDEILNKIRLFEFKLDKLQEENGDELAILKVEQQLDRLYSMQHSYD